MGLHSDITVSVTLVSPFLMQGLDVAALGIDAAALRDDRGEGHPIIPADQVKGLLSAACITLADAGVEIDGVAVNRTLIGQLFGRPSDEGGGEWGAPQRGAIIFGDLIAPPQEPASFTRVSIDGTTGAAKNGALQTVELVAPLGQRVTFSGTAIVRFDPRTTPAPATKTAAEWVTALLNAALGAIPAVGSLKTAGFGQVAAASATMTRAEPLTLPDPPPTLAPVVRRYVEFDRRLLVDAERVADNVWKGQEIVPGSVFKGALAERLRLAGKDTHSGSPFGRALAAMRFSHAFPAGEDGRPAGFTPPLSLHVYEHKDDKHKDDKHKDDPLYGACALSTGGPDALPPCATHKDSPAIPRFAPDWKEAERERLLTAIGWPVPPTLPPQPRGHTAIGKDYVAADQKLFVDVGLSTHHQKWCLEISRGAADPTDFKTLVAALEQGLDGIGATGARATFSDPGDTPWDWPSSFDAARTGDGLWAVTLATPALMFRAPKPGMDPVAQYKDYWKIHAGAELVDVFASQKLTGGYLGLRRRMYGHDRYYPFVLTQPGSVFLLRGVTGERLKELVHTGLPAQAPEGMAPGVPLTWENCPYLPENGYGAILVNAIDHATLARGRSLSSKEAS